MRDLVQHLPDLVRLLARLVDKSGPAEFDQHALGAGRDQRARRADQHLPPPRRRARRLGHFRDAGPQRLKDLFHVKRIAGIMLLFPV